MTNPESIAAMFYNWRARYADRDMRHYIIDEVLRGNLAVVDPDEETLEMRSPNLIQVALEDTAEAASLVPTVRVRPTRPGDRAKKQADQMEQIGTSILDANDIDLLIPRTVMDLGRAGLAAYTVTPDFDEKRVRIELRDPTQCYPEPGFRPGDKTRRVIFARSVYWSQLPIEFQTKLKMHVNDMPDQAQVDMNDNVSVSLVEYYDEQEIVVLAVIEGARMVYAESKANVAYIPVELSRVEHGLGVCPSVVEGRITFDGEFRGQFDQVTQMLADHVRLTGMLLDYADQSVYSDVWVRDLIGELPYGGGAYIELGPNGAIGRVPPAVSSLNIGQDLQALVDGIHVGSRWPKSRPGEIDQSIASAKFLETSAGLMNTAIRTYHMILQRLLKKTLRVAFIMDHAMFAGEDRLVAGSFRNHEYSFAYDPGKAIDPSAEISVEYGLGLGRDPAQSAVLHIQYSKDGFISQEFVQENIDGLKDVPREQARIDLQDLVAMMKAKLLQGIEAGTIPDAALVEIARARTDGESIIDLFDEYVVKPQQQSTQGLIPSGLGGMMQPGAVPGAPPPGPPGLPAGPVPPPAPGGTELMARMNVPAGPGGTLGTQVMGGGRG